MRLARAGSRAIPVAGHGAAIREARVAQGTGPLSGTDWLSRCAVATATSECLVKQKPGDSGLPAALDRHHLRIEPIVDPIIVPAGHLLNSLVRE